METLYVDRLTPPVSGYTNDLDKIRYNCNLIDPEILEMLSSEIEANYNITSSFPAGKYICLLAIYLDKKEYSMIFYDLHNNDEALYKMLNLMHREHEEIREMIISSYNAIKSNYPAWKDKFELREGNPNT